MTEDQFNQLLGLIAVMFGCLFGAALIIIVLLVL